MTDRMSVDELRAMQQGGERSIDPLGLSKAHIRPLKKENERPYSAKLGTVSYFPDSHLIKVKTPWTSTDVKKTSKRGKVRGFSRQSRRRMMTMVARIKNEMLPLFITLTYPSIFPSTKQSKRDLKVFIQRMKRRWPGHGAIWKLEYQKRGAPHYHMLAWGIPLAEALEHISKMWYEVCGKIDNKHLLAGTRVEQIRHHRGVMAYAAKYIGKIQEEEIEEGCGRIWGYYGSIPFAEEVRILINRNMAIKLLRCLNRYVGISNRRMRTYFVGHSGKWLELHEKITGDFIRF